MKSKWFSIIISLILIVLAAAIVLWFFKPAEYEVAPATGKFAKNSVLSSSVRPALLLEVNAPQGQISQINAILDQNIPSALFNYLVKLKNHENCPPEGIIDTNNKRSYGPFCFQKDTFIPFFKKYIQPGAEDSEAFNLISDPQVQFVLAYNMIKDGGWRHWKTSVKKIGMPPL